MPDLCEGSCSALLCSALIDQFEEFDYMCGMWLGDFICTGEVSQGRDTEGRSFVKWNKRSLFPVVTSSLMSMYK